MQKGVINYLPKIDIVDDFRNNGIKYFKQEEIDLDSPTYEERAFPSSTCKLPCQQEYPGPYEFDMQFNAEASMRNKWLYSQIFKKIYVSMLSKLSIQFKWIKKEAGLRVRAMLVYCSEDDFETPVLRCPNHSSPVVPCNIGFKHLDHIIRCDHDRAEYHKDADSQRLSVVVPLDAPHPGTDWVTIVYTFVCKNSCPVGMNRRATAVIFTLERSNGEVIGRRRMGVRICSCPKRDKEKEEQYSNKIPGSGRNLYRPRNVPPAPEYDCRVDDSEQNHELENPSPVEMEINADFHMDEEAATDNTEEVHGVETENEEDSDEGSSSREPDVNSNKYLKIRKDSFLLPPNKRRIKDAEEKTTNNALTIMKCMTDLASSRDEFVIFGEHVAMKLRNIKDPKVRLLLQHKISNLLFEGEMTNFGVEMKQNDLCANELPQYLLYSVPHSSSRADSRLSSSTRSSPPQNSVSSSYPVLNRDSRSQYLQKRGTSQVPRPSAGR